jgi:pyruvate/2-oxoglutarate dehydrogenase complex dihydrolipoamide dehydrogenase (E3) component
VALIERGHVGGTCVNVGCTPTKTMVASARLAYLARRSADYGIHTGPVAVDLPAIRARKQGMVEFARTAAEGRITAVPKGLDLLRGAAHFIAPKTLEVHLTSGERQQITAPTIFINAGQRPKPLQITGVATLLAAKGYRVIVPYLRGDGTTRFLSNETLRNGQQSVVAPGLQDIHAPSV